MRGRRIHSERMFHPMSAAAEPIERRWLRFLVEREASRDDAPLACARERVARRAGVAPGTLENLDRGRIKGGVRRVVSDALARLFIRTAEAQIRALEHEISIARQASSTDGDRLLAKAEALVEALRAATDRENVT